jgi:hypothetical protein
MRGATQNRQESFNNAGAGKIRRQESLTAGLRRNGVNSDWLIGTSWDLGKTYHILVGNFDAHRFPSFTLQKMLFNHDAPTRVGHKRPRGFLMDVRDAILGFYALSHK